MNKGYFIKGALLLLIPWYIISFSFSIPILPYPHLILKEVVLELMKGASTSSFTCKSL